ncbi:MAG: dTMP kinase [Candidatus Kapaibacteriota bacterium]
MFITFEGIDGSGKSTQIEYLKEWLETRGHRVTVLREPGGNTVSENIRTLLLDSRETIDPRSELLLFTAARAQLVSKVIRPALQQNNIVICDRYIDSSVAYQGYGRGLPVEEIEQINAFATNNLIPDITFIFDLSVEDASKRAGFRSSHTNSSPDRMERSGEDFFRKTREGYLQIAKNSERKIFIIEANGHVEDIREEICNIVEPFILTS